MLLVIAPLTIWIDWPDDSAGPAITSNPSNEGALGIGSWATFAKFVGIDMVMNVGMEHLSKKGSSQEAVSYTHLDVYKRQAFQPSRRASG